MYLVAGAAIAALFLLIISAQQPPEVIHEPALKPATAASALLESELGKLRELLHQQQEAAQRHSRLV